MKRRDFLTTAGGTMAASLLPAELAWAQSSTSKPAVSPLMATLSLAAADDGETWQTYPHDAVDSAVIDGGGAHGVNGIVINGGSNITIAGLTFQNVDVYGVGIHGGMSDSGGCCGPGCWWCWSRPPIRARPMRWCGRCWRRPPG